MHTAKPNDQKLGFYLLLKIPSHSVLQIDPHKFSYFIFYFFFSYFIYRSCQLFTKV